MKQKLGVGDLFRAIGHLQPDDESTAREIAGLLGISGTVYRVIHESVLKMVDASEIEALSSADEDVFFVETDNIEESFEATLTDLEDTQFYVPDELSPIIEQAEDETVEAKPVDDVEIEPLEEPQSHGGIDTQTAPKNFEDDLEQQAIEDTSTPAIDTFGEKGFMLTEAEQDEITSFGSSLDGLLLEENDELVMKFEIRSLSAVSPPVPDWATKGISIPKDVPRRLEQMYPISLLPPHWTRTLLMDLLGSEEEIGQIDVQVLIQHMAQGKVIQKIPRERVKTFTHGVQVLVDISESMTIFSDDQNLLIHSLLQVFGSDKVEILRFRDSPSWGVFREGDFEPVAYEPSLSHSPVLILSDLGLSQQTGYSRYATRQDWLDFFQDTSEQTKITAFVPHPPRYWPQGFHKYVTLYYWDRHNKQRLVESDATKDDNKKQDIERQQHTLARYLSLATRAELPLIRTIRLETLPDIDAGTEANLWLSNKVSIRNVHSIVLKSQYRAELQVELAQDRHLLDRLWEVLEDYRMAQRASVAILVEERITYLSLVDTEQSREEIRALYQALIRTLRDPQRQRLANWVVRALNTLPQSAKIFTEHHQAQYASYTRLGSRLIPEHIIHSDIVQWTWLLPDNMPFVDIGIELNNDGLVFSDPPSEASQRLSVPATSPRILVLKQDDQQYIIRLNENNEVVRVKAQTPQILALDGLKVELDIPLEVLSQFLKSDNPKTRQQAANLLGNLKDKTAIPALVRRLRVEDDQSVIVATMQAIGDIGDEGVIPYLIAAFDSGRQILKEQIVHTLQRIDHPMSFQALMNLWRKGEVDFKIRHTLQEAISSSPYSKGLRRHAKSIQNRIERPSSQADEAKIESPYLTWNEAVELSIINEDYIDEEDNGLIDAEYLDWLRDNQVDPAEIADFVSMLDDTARLYTQSFTEPELPEIDGDVPEVDSDAEVGKSAFNINEYQPIQDYAFPKLEPIKDDMFDLDYLFSDDFDITDADEVLSYDALEDVINHEGERGTLDWDRAIQLGIVDDNPPPQQYFPRERNETPDDIIKSIFQQYNLSLVGYSSHNQLQEARARIDEGLRMIRDTQSDSLIAALLIESEGTLRDGNVANVRQIQSTQQATSLPDWMQEIQQDSIPDIDLPSWLNDGE